MNRQSIEAEIRMNKIFTQNCSASSIIWGIQIKTGRFCFTPVTPVWKLLGENVGENVENWEHCVIYTDFPSYSDKEQSRGSNAAFPVPAISPTSSPATLCLPLCSSPPAPCCSSSRRCAADHWALALVSLTWNTRPNSPECRCPSLPSALCSNITFWGRLPSPLW